MIKVTDSPERMLGRTCRACHAEGEVWTTIGTDNMRLAFCLCAKCADGLRTKLAVTIYPDLQQPR
jgi:hypothetical protein